MCGFIFALIVVGAMCVSYPILIVPTVLILGGGLWAKAYYAAHPNA